MNKLIDEYFETKSERGFVAWENELLEHSQKKNKELAFENGYLKDKKERLEKEVKRLGNEVIQLNTKLLAYEMVLQFLLMEEN